MFLLKLMGAAVFLASCGAATPRTTTEPPKVEAKGGAQAKGIEKEAPAEDLSIRVLQYLPKDRSVIIHLSWSKLQASPMYQSGGLSRSGAFDNEVLGGLLKWARDVVGPMQDKCGLDLRAAVDSISLAMTVESSNGLFVLSGQLDQGKLESCITTAGGSVANGVYSLGANVVHAYWPAPGTLLLSDQLTSADMSKALEAGSVLEVERVMSLLEKVNPAATLWAVGSLSDIAAGGPSDMGVSYPDSFFVQVDVQVDAALKADLKFLSEDAAREIVPLAHMGLSMLAGDAVFWKDRQLEQLSEHILITVQLSAADAASTPPRPQVAETRFGPDPSINYAVPVADSPWQGAPDALVTLVEGYEYACHFCEKARATLGQLLKDYPGDLKIVYRSFLVHPAIAREPALAICAANLQGRFSTMHELLWADAFGLGKFSRQHIEKLARRAKLGMRRFRRDRDGVCEGRVSRDQEDLQKLGLAGTPGFWINGRFVSGAKSLAVFKMLIEEELAKAKQAINGNKELTSKNYYQREILDKGKSEL